MQLRGERGRASEEQTVSRTTCGTWLYTAPEVYKKEPYSAKVDQFAFAMILYELLQGAAPFKSLTAEEATVQLALGHRPELRPEVHPELRDLVLRCWAHDPATRPPFSKIQRLLQTVLAQLQPADFEEKPQSRFSMRTAAAPRVPSYNQRGKPVAAPEQPPSCGCTLC